VKLRRMVAGGQKQTLTIPAHAELDVGTLKAIIRQATRYIPETELRPHFYSDEEVGCSNRPRSTRTPAIRLS
jgi:hypothetical protein